MVFAFVITRDEREAPSDKVKLQNFSQTKVGTFEVTNKIFLPIKRQQAKPALPPTKIEDRPSQNWFKTIKIEYF